MLETIHNLKEDLDLSIKVDNEKLIKEIFDQEKINEIWLIKLAKNKQNGQVGQISSNAEQGSIKEESLKRKEPETTNEHSELVESLEKEKMMITSDISTLKEL